MLSKSNEFGKKVGRYGVRKVWQQLQREVMLLRAIQFSIDAKSLKYKVYGVVRIQNMVLDALSYVSSFELEAMYDYKINPLGQVA